MPTYARADVAFERGEGPYLYDEEGRRYLDFGTGIATASLGHAHPAMVEAISKQAATVMHVSNLYRIKGQERLAERLCANTFAERVFFCNSGAEANEALIKLIRRYQFASGHPERYRIITFTNCFHGRTLATIAATGTAKVLEGFGPKVDGFDHVDVGDLAKVEALIGDKTAGILIEPVQGEGGIIPIADDFLLGLRKLCDKHGLLLGLDEVQSGMGRTGKLLAAEWSGVKPDVVSLGKGIAGGFPVGACLATAEAAKGMVAGTHGSTYGGNPLAMAAGNAVLDVLLAPGFMEGVQAVGQQLMEGLKALQSRNDSVIETVRGKGLFIGVKTKVPNGDVVNALRAKGLITVPAADNIVRLLPPLTIDRAVAEEALGLFEDVCRDLGQ